MSGGHNRHPEIKPGDGVELGGISLHLAATVTTKHKHPQVILALDFVVLDTRGPVVRIVVIVVAATRRLHTDNGGGGYVYILWVYGYVHVVNRVPVVRCAMPS